MNALRNTLTQDAFWQINKALVSAFGIEGAVVLTDLIEKYYHFSDRKQTIKRDEKDWFFFTAEDIQDTFKISYKVQKRVLMELRDKNLIETKVMQVPAKVHIHLCERNVLKFLNEASIAQTSKLELPKRQYLNCPKGKTNYNNTIDNNSLFNNKEYDVFEEFVETFNKIRKAKFKPLDKLRPVFAKRLKTYSKEDILHALTNAMATQHHIDNKFNDLTPEFILREDKLEKYINYNSKKESQVKEAPAPAVIDHRTRALKPR
ncbi:hypothetical protein [Mucilaginibacter xinganensis]|uniref:Uncharacterized protein n=1 Tax=Mucilaginibacter xinganensis TaxID=1234841 RepID=A0A223NX15_9SPHI|nr:hypothetical protein [Mucilaginibacter xinganensis]ASU34366.1 hypothetical protein MuYL_2479 [Mucilaginibacter xinganensis]